MVQNLLEGKRGIIFGALNDKSIAWKVALKAKEQGASFTLSNTAVACRMGEVIDLSKMTGSELIPADATSVDDLKTVFSRSQEVLGGKIDFVLHSIGMSLNVRKKRDYYDLDYNFLNKTLDISAISFHKMLQVAYQMDAISEWGSVVALSYVAAQPTMTTAGSGVKGFDGLMDFSDRMSPLGNASADDCANFCVTMFSDLTKKITMQNLFHDGGFSSMGMSMRAMTQYNKSFDGNDSEAQ